MIFRLLRKLLREKKSKEEILEEFEDLYDFVKEYYTNAELEPA